MSSGFIALLIIFITALSAASAVFVGLRMGHKDEAFGLPAGSVRALLAIGIMILFVVFGLPLISPKQEVQSSGAVAVPAERLAATIGINKEQGFEVRVLDAGTPADPAGAPAAAAQQARIEILRMNGPSAAHTDLNKQMLTAIITLLTTVIGFYFGSRSAADGVKEGETAAGRAAVATAAAGQAAQTPVSRAPQNPPASPTPPQG